MTAAAESVPSSSCADRTDAQEPTGNHHRHSGLGTRRPSVLVLGDLGHVSVVVGVIPTVDLLGVLHQRTPGSPSASAHGEPRDDEGPPCEQCTNEGDERKALGAASGTSAKVSSAAKTATTRNTTLPTLVTPHTAIQGEAPPRARCTLGTVTARWWQSEAIGIRGPTRPARRSASFIPTS